MFWRWWRMEKNDRPRVWLLYGWFSGLQHLGSVCGAVAWGAWMQFRVDIYISGAATDRSVKISTFAQSQYWRAAFFVTYALEFLCLSVAKLLVLDRMADFAAAKGDDLSRRLAFGGRGVMAAVVVGHVVGLCGNVAAAVYFKESGDLYSAAAAALATNSTDTGNHFFNLAIQKNQLASAAASVQQFCEVAVLLIIILAFAIVGISGARRVNSALRDMNDAQGATVRKLRLQIVGTTAFVFVTFLLRAVFSIMNALADALQNNSATCPSHFICDPTCYNLHALMQNWLQFTPEFQLIIELISSPLALLVALWGMTSDRALQLMSSSRRQVVAIGDSMELRTK